jgi:hypothetical protein
MELIYSEIDDLLNIFSELEMFSKAKLARILNKFVNSIEIEDRKIIAFRKEVEKSGNLKNVTSLENENPNWRLPTILEFLEIKKNEIEFKHSKYWVIDENNFYVRYNIETGRSLNRVTHDSYLDFDGSDFSTFTPFNELDGGIKLVRDF